MLGSKSTKNRIRQALLFGFLAGCFATAVFVIVGLIFWFSGVVSPGPVSTTLYWLLAVFGVSTVTFFLVILAFEDFLEP